MNVRADFLYHALRLFILGALSILAVFCAFVLVPTNLSVRIVEDFNYWYAAILFAVWIFLIWRAVRSWSFSWDLVKRHRAGLLVVLACGGLLHLHEPHEFKVLFDEYVLAGTAHQMHETRHAFTPLRAHDVNGDIHMLGGIVDKRPVLFPFLLSLVHDVTGFRLENSFVLNFGLTFVLLGLMYVIGNWIGSRSIGILGVVLITSLPLLAQNVTGAGFEVLNAVMILAFIVAAYNYLRSPGLEGQNLFVVTALLLGQVRYESHLFLIALAGVVLCKWISERQISLTWFSTVSPALLFLPCNHYQVFVFNRGFWQLEDSDVAVFDLKNLGENMESAIFFLFDYDLASTNSVLLSVVGVISFAFFALLLRSEIKAFFTKPGMSLVLYAVLAIVLLNLLVVLAYYWGQLGDPVVSRLSLPLHLMFALCACRVVQEFVKRGLNVAWAISPVVVFIFAVTIPTNAQHKVTESLYTTEITNWFLGHLEEFKNERVLVIAESSLPYLLREYAAVPYTVVSDRLNRLEFVLEKGIYDEILVLQSFMIHPKDFSLISDTRVDFGSYFEQETIAETTRRFSIVSRIGRVTRVKTELATETSGLGGFDAMSESKVNNLDMEAFGDPAEGYYDSFTMRINRAHLLP